MRINNFLMINTLNLLNDYMTYKLPQKISYAIIKNHNLLKNDAAVYNAAYEKLEQRYAEFFQKDKDDNVCRNELGTPLFTNNEIGEKFTDELAELLNIENDYDFYYIDESYFDYDDSDCRYDVLLPKDILVLQSIICEHPEQEEDEQESREVKSKTGVTKAC